MRFKSKMLCHVNLAHSGGLPELSPLTQYKRAIVMKSRYDLPGCQKNKTINRIKVSK